MRAIEKIEKFFNMSFEKIISDLHWKDGLSLFALSKRCKVSRDSFQKEANRRGIKLMSFKEAAKRRHEHHKHWATGLTKETCSSFDKISNIMKENNPSKNKKIRSKMSRTMSNNFKKNLLPQEIKFKEYLDKYSKYKYETQFPIEQYIIDFFIFDLNLCIEIDSTDKWGKSRFIAATTKDRILMDLKYRVLRINKRYIDNELYIVDILNSNNIISN